MSIDGVRGLIDEAWRGLQQAHGHLANKWFPCDSKGDQGDGIDCITRQRVLKNCEAEQLPAEGLCLGCLARWHILLAGQALGQLREKVNEKEKEPAAQ